MLSLSRLVCFVVLFVFLCITGGELCARGAARFLPGLLGPDGPDDRRDPGPERPVQEAFRGLSPLPPPGNRLLPATALRPGAGRHAG